MSTDPHRIDSIEGLRAHYRQPSDLVRGKERPQLDAATIRFVERCRFAVVATFDAEGNADASPRGGESGFIRVLDPQHVAIADLNGNNRLDTLENIVRTGRVALLLVTPGKSETVRINGAAWVTTDPEVLGGFTLPKVPKTAIVVRVDTTYIHCAKAFMRSGMWDADAWAALADSPDGADILACQIDAGIEPEAIRAGLADSYAADLAADRE